MTIIPLAWPWIAFAVVVVVVLVTRPGVLLFGGFVALGLTAIAMTLQALPG